MPQVSDGKVEALRAQRALHPHPERVEDELFQGGHPFFDSRDVVQVKYEMLRRVEQDGCTVVEAVRRFGFSRPVFYQTSKAFAEGGLPALLHERPGPRGRHKLKPEVLGFLGQLRSENPDWGARQLAKELQEHFQLQVHPRTIERALRPRERVKGGHSR